MINGSVYVDIELNGGYEYAEVLTQRYDPSSGVYGYDARREFKGIISDSTRLYETLSGLEPQGFVFVFFKKQVLAFLFFDSFFEPTCQSSALNTGKIVIFYFQI